MRKLSRTVVAAALVFAPLICLSAPLSKIKEIPAVSAGVGRLFAEGPETIKIVVKDERPPDPVLIAGLMERALMSAALIAGYSENPRAVAELFEAGAKEAVQPPGREAIAVGGTSRGAGFRGSSVVVVSGPRRIPRRAEDNPRRVGHGLSRRPLHSRLGGERMGEVENIAVWRARRQAREDIPLGAPPFVLEEPCPGCGARRVVAMVWRNDPSRSSRVPFPRVEPHFRCREGRVLWQEITDAPIPVSSWSAILGRFDEVAGAES